MVQVQRVDEYHWSIAKKGVMRTGAIVLADDDLIAGFMKDRALDQLASVAALPGIVGPALVMPDGHQGYGFPIGCVAAFDALEGIVSPGGVGYDINCGVRLQRSKLRACDLNEKTLSTLADVLAGAIPAGVGKRGPIGLGQKELAAILAQGATWAVARGMGVDADLEFCESQGAIPGADPTELSPKALSRGLGQLGTLGGGNHFVELGEVEEVFEENLARGYGLFQGQLVAWIHCGSRGLGHQVCGDFLKYLGKSKEVVRPPDRQLISAPVESSLGRRYLAAMSAAANFAFANRQVLSHLVREAMMSALGLSPTELGMGLVYDVAHNIAKMETHQVEGMPRKLLVHRKGATRALGPNHTDIPSHYKNFGQPVLVPGDMGRASYVLAGTARAEAETFASSTHGAGRKLSRTAAIKRAQGRPLSQELATRGVFVRACSPKTLAEEMPEAYKDAAQVVGVIQGGGISKKVVKTRPLVVIKG